MDRPYQVLIFDDDVALGELLRDYFTIACNCVVTLVQTENEFWSTLRACTFDILLLDYQLQDTTGLEVLEKMNGEHCQIPTVMMTGHGSEKIASRAIQMGAIDYLVKGDLSFSYEMLPNLIQKAVHMRRLQQMAQESGAKLEYQAMLLENVRDALVVWDQKEVITYWNPAAEELYGRVAAEMLGQSAGVFYQLFKPELKLSDPQWQESRVQRGERIYNLSGNDQVWISYQIQPLYNSAHQLCGTMDVGRDITLSKIEHQELDRNRHLLQRVLSTIPTLIYIFNLRSNQIDYITPRIDWLLGPNVSDNPQSRNPFFFSLVEPKDLPAVVKYYNDLATLKDGEIREIEYRIKVKIDEWRWLKNRDTLFARDSGGKAVEVIGACEDITTRKHMEEKLLQRLNGEKMISSMSSAFIDLPAQNLLTAPSQALQESLRSVTEFFGLEYGMLFLNTQGQMRNVLRYNRSARAVQAPDHAMLDFALERYPWLAGAIKRQSLLVIQSPESLPAEAASEFEELVRNHVKSALVLPLIHQEELVGLFIFGTLSAELHWDKESETLLQSFGRVVLKAILQRRGS